MLETQFRNGQKKKFRSVIIPHGVDERFRKINFIKKDIKSSTIKCLYISNIARYKHQIEVVRAINIIREEGIDIQLTLVGGGVGKAYEDLREEIQFLSCSNFVFLKEFLDKTELPGQIEDSDIFIFASSCENMPNTLLEGMAAGAVIACSKSGPMPEVLEDGGVYFDPEIPESIANAIITLINDDDLRYKLAARAYVIAEKYSWARCAAETFEVIENTFKELTAK